MSTAALAARRPRRCRSKYVPVLATLALLLVMYVDRRDRATRPSPAQVILNIFVDNAFLLVVAVGMTFVILTGGIDLSVGAVVALGTVLCGTLLRSRAGRRTW